MSAEVLGGRFREVWLWDFEFRQTPGECPEPICMVALELNSGVFVRRWRDQLGESPFKPDCDVLFLGYYAAAEVACHLALGWPVPENVLDLYVEFRNFTNGLVLPSGAGLLGALRYFGLPALGEARKEEMRALATRGGLFTPDERQQLLEYCESDVVSLKTLLLAVQAEIDVPRALERGRYMVAVARIERVGVPIDAVALHAIRTNLPRIRETLISELDVESAVFVDGRFSEKRFLEFCARNDIHWPRLTSGRPKLDDDTFGAQTELYPALRNLHELRRVLSRLRTNDLTVGADGRNRTMLSAFGSKTGRNQPSNSRFIFGLPGWFRGLIKPEEGRVIVYIDWCQQEFGIAAFLSGDSAMQEAYLSGDPYLAFAKQAGAAPETATRESHAEVREQYKQCALAVLYGMGPDSLARELNIPVAYARQLLEAHRRTYKRFWQWSDATEMYAQIHRGLCTVLGWHLHLGRDVGERTLRNFPMQANGSEMLRIAACIATDYGLKVCALVHDALLVECAFDSVDKAIARTRLAMDCASAIVLGGNRLRTDAEVTRYPDRVQSGRSREMWERIYRLALELNALG